MTTEEKKWVVQTTAIVREVMKEESRAKKKTPFDLLKHPLFLLLAGALVSGIIIHGYQGRQARISEREKAKDALLIDISSVTGTLLTRAEEVLGLHQTPIENEPQIVATNRAYNEASDLYASNLLKIEHSLRILFQDESTIKGWNEIQTGFEDLKDRLALLHEIKTTVISQEHSKRIAACKDKIGDIAAKLKQYGRALIDKLR